MIETHRTPGNELIQVPAEGFAALFGYVEQTVLCCDEIGGLLFASPALKTLLGYDPESMIGQNLLDFLHPDDVSWVVESMKRWTDRPGAPLGQVLRVRASDGSWRPIRYDAVMGADLGALGSMVITLYQAEDHDPAAHALRHRLLNADRVVRLASAFLHVSYDRFDEGLDTVLRELSGLDWVTRVSVWVVEGSRRSRVRLRGSWSAPTNGPLVSLDTRIRIADSPMLSALEAGGEVYLDSAWAQAEDDKERRTFNRAGLRSVLAIPMSHNGDFTGLAMLESTIGDVAHDAMTTTTLRSAAAILASAFVRHDAERALAVQARTDRVTGLGNRWAFDEAIGEALAEVAAGRSRGFGLALVDLDRFKLVNDALGHAAGDRLLRDLATRLQGSADDQTVIARLGGDELLLLVRESPTVADTYRRVERLTESLVTPFDLAGQAVRVTASVGVVHVDHAADNAGELLRRADVAMYRAKAVGGHTIEIDDPDAAGDDWSTLRRENELRQAVRSGSLLVYFQGEWDLIDGHLLGAEALVRWQHPREGLLEAGSFVPLAEERGLIDELGRLVLRDACRAAATWNSLLGPDRFVLRVNLAADQLRHPDLAERVCDVLSDAGLPASALCLELTESTLLADPVGSARTFAQLREQGIGLAIDDFGTGYSSMLQLKQLPLTALKIDRSFVSGLPDAGIDRAIVRSTMQLADALGMSVTAEGVETESQRDALVELGCTRAQGYLLARPEPASTFALRVDHLAASPPG
ncbi:MAG: GGDEF and EAL domain-containing protein [Aquihabitans sp.]